MPRSRMARADTQDTHKRKRDAGSAVGVCASRVLKRLPQCPGVVSTKDPRERLLQQTPIRIAVNTRPAVH